MFYYSRLLFYYAHMTFGRAALRLVTTFFRAASVALLASISASGQLTKEQKVADFNQLAATFAKNYTAYEWKRDIVRYDILSIQPWLDKVAQSKDDLDFYDICIDYLSRLEDANSVFGIDSTFTADLHFSADIYDGKVLIDGIDRTALPAKQFPFQIGDEVISVDGQTSSDLIQNFLKYATFSNPVARRRLAAFFITFRDQSIMPRAHEIADTAKVVVLRQNGAMETYDVPWLKSGTPLLGVGPAPSPKKTATRAVAVSESLIDGSRISSQFSGRNQADFEGPKATPFPGLFPNFNPPSSFKIRLGTSAPDLFVSGTFKSDTLTLGYLRIHNFANTAAALRQIQTETTYFQQNTDGLVIDATGTDSASFCGEEAYLSYFIPHTFQGLGYEYRATEFWLNAYASQLQAAKNANAAQWIVDLYSAYLKEMQQAYSERGGKTGPLPACRVSLSAEPAKDAAGNIIAYTKPIVLLTDEMSYADVFAAIFQDEQRGLIVGQRTSGLGGGAIQYYSGNYSEGFAVVGVSQLTRSKLVATPDYPVTSFIENVGVRPDIVVEYQTKDNLLNGGSMYVDTITAAAVDWIKKNR